MEDKENITASHKIKILAILLISLLVFSCNDTEVLNNCDKQTLKSVKRIFPTSKITRYPYNYDYYIYIVSDDTGVKKVTCSCHTYGGLVRTVELLETNL